MRPLLVALLLLFLQPPAPVFVQATFTTSTSAAVWWEQPADPPGLTHTCLRIYHIGVADPAGICFNDLPAGMQRVDLPGTLSDKAYQPAFGDRIVLAINMDDVGETTLGEVPSVYQVYLPLLTQQHAPETERVYVAVVRGG